MKSDTKFKEKLACSFKHEMRNLMNFHPTTQKSKILLLWALFIRSIKIWAKKNPKKTRRNYLHDTEQWCKIFINLYPVVSKMAWGIGWTFIKSEKLYFDGLFFSKVYTVSARKFQRNYVSWHWNVMLSLKEN